MSKKSYFLCVITTVQIPKTAHNTFISEENVIDIFELLKVIGQYVVIPSE